MMAGLDFADGDAVLIMDADLQHPPALIPTMVAAWRAGYDDVCGKRTDREGRDFPQTHDGQFLLPLHAGGQPLYPAA